MSFTAVRRLSIIVAVLLIGSFAFAETTYKSSLTWDLNSEADNVIGYKVYRSEVSKEYGKEPIANVAPNDPTFIDNNIEVGKTYYYVVTAYNEIGESGFSDEVFKSFTSPEVPTGLTISVVITVN